MEMIIKEFNSYLLIEKGLQPATADAYVSDIRQLAMHYDLVKMTTEDIRQYLTILHDKGIEAPSIKRKVSAIKIFFRHLCKIKLIEHDPTLKIELAKSKHRLPSVFSLEEFERIVAVCDVNEVNGIRDRLICELLFGCGLRVSELVGLTINNISLEQEIIRVDGKGNKQRLIPLPSTTKEWIIKYLQMIRVGGKKYLLTTRSGNKMSRMRIYDIILMRVQQAGINKMITPHTFRHSAATQLLENGVDLKTLQEYLGHADIGTTKIYTHVQTKTLKQAVKRFHPRLEEEE